jgi:hypothetical protein
MAGAILGQKAVFLNNLASNPLKSQPFPATPATNRAYLLPPLGTRRVPRGRTRRVRPLVGSIQTNHLVQIQASLELGSGRFSAGFGRFPSEIQIKPRKSQKIAPAEKLFFRKIISLLRNK